jgi:hypothetical protein
LEWSFRWIFWVSAVFGSLPRMLSPMLFVEADRRKPGALIRPPGFRVHSPGPVKAVGPPPTDEALHAAHQRQGRVFHPVPARRMGRSWPYPFSGRRKEWLKSGLAPLKLAPPLSWHRRKAAHRHTQARSLNNAFGFLS